MERRSNQLSAETSNKIENAHRLCLIFYVYSTLSIILYGDEIFSDDEILKNSYGTGILLIQMTAYCKYHQLV